MSRSADASAAAAGLTASAAARRWPATADEARRLQRQLRSEVIAEDCLGGLRQVAGLDAHHAPEEQRTWGAAVLLRFPGLDPVEGRLVAEALRFPYIPGLLSFREAPVMLEALDRLSVRPDLLMVDGHGMAHPRRMGIASHVGLAAGIPTIGIAKTRLVGRYDDPGPERGAWTPLVSRGEVIGAALRTRRATLPVFVSVGHGVSLATAVDLVMQCTPRFRLPEPIRQADRLSREHPHRQARR